MEGQDSRNAYIMSADAYDSLMEVYDVFKAMTSVIGCEESDFTDMPMQMRIGTYYILKRFLALLDESVLLSLRGFNPRNGLKPEQMKAFQ